MKHGLKVDDECHYLSVQCCLMMGFTVLSGGDALVHFTLCYINENIFACEFHKSKCGRSDILLKIIYTGPRAIASVPLSVSMFPLQTDNKTSNPR